MEPEPQRELTFNGEVIVRLRVDYEGRKKRRAHMIPVAQRDYVQLHLIPGPKQTVQLPRNLDVYTACVG